jgi:endogenous inhibitor of DNA gyrase (YacG/DUF329 family)
MAAMARCPICKKNARPRTENPAYPFCSPRCKQVDLGKWLNEEYRVPAEESSSSDDDASNGNGAPHSEPRDGTSPASPERGPHQKER